MKRSPGFFIFAFVGLSMALAVAYHRFQQSDLEAKIDGQESFASAPPFSSEARKVMREIASASESVTDEFRNCQCVAKGKSSKLFQTTEKENCAQNSDFFQNEFEKLPLDFRGRRATSSAEFPRLCVIRILNSQTAQLSSQCGKQNRICVTEEYVNVVYNTYADVLSCYNLPQKEVLPWFLVNGGFQLNSPNGISGLNIESAEATELLDKSKKYLSASDDPNCQKILPLATKLSIPNDPCYFVNPPQNPLLSFLIFAQKFTDKNAELKKTISLGQDADSERVLLAQTLLTLSQRDQQNIASEQLATIREAMLKASQKLNREFKEGTCVSDSLLTH